VSRNTFSKLAELCLLAGSGWCLFPPQMVENDLVAEQAMISLILAAAAQAV